VKQRVPDEAAGERLDRFLASLPAVGSRGMAERLLESGAVLVDGAPLGKSQRLSGGVASVLERTALSVVNGAIQLSVGRGEEALVGDAVERRLLRLADSFGSEPVIATI